MTRIRWLSARWPVPLRTLAIRMRKSQFARNTLDGFIIDSVRDSSIEGEFIEKYEFENSIVDPFGEKLVSRSIDFRRTRFILKAEFPQIEIHNGLQSAKLLLNRLSQLNKFAVTISVIDVDIAIWAEAIEEAVGERAVLEAIQAGAVQCDAGITGKIFLSGGSGVRDELLRMIRTRSHQIEKLTFKIQDPDGEQTVSLGHGACARIGGKVKEKAIVLLRETLQAVSRHAGPG